MKTLNNKTFTLNGTEWELLNNITGELPLESDEKLLERVIKVYEFYEDDSKEPDDSFFGTENTFVRDFRGNGKLFRMLFISSEKLILVSIAGVSNSTFKAFNSTGFLCTYPSKSVYGSTSCIFTYGL